MTLNLKAYVYISNSLWDAVQDFVGEGGSVTDVILPLPSGKAWKLDTDFRITLGFNKVKYVVWKITGRANIKMPSWLFPAYKWAKTRDIKFPNSENWYYYRGDPKAYHVGTWWDPDEVYMVFEDSTYDFAVIGLVFALVIVLDYIGLERLGELFTARALGQVSTARRIQTIYTEMDDTIANTIAERTKNIEADATDDVTENTLKNLVKQTKVQVGAELDSDTPGSVADEIRRIYEMHENNNGIIELLLTYLYNPHYMDRPAVSVNDLIKPSEVT